ncbi:hypothetical protein H8356DRAFT_1364191 [Neocallimastix lanati (nom. inval.)]|nr:hypothetical protein H8356DRAFT_1364191 [Neocallimastix sp. JGI-2020a]
MINPAHYAISNVIYLYIKESTIRYTRDLIQNNLSYNIPNIQGNRNRMIIPSNNYGVNLTLQEKGFHLLNEISHINRVNNNIKYLITSIFKEIILTIVNSNLKKLILCEYKKF